MASDLISRDALLEDLRESANWLHKIYGDLKYEDEKRICGAEIASFTEVIMRVKDFPAVDAVEVVRCRDCVHAGAFPNAYAARRFEGGMNCYLCRGDDGYGIANVSLVYPDDYCSDGVRKEKKDGANP